MTTPSLPAHLFPFQHEDVAELLTQPRRFFLEPMGAGKSVMCIAACEALDAYTIVIVCPAILRADWQAKFSAFGRNNYSFEATGPGRRVVTVSYEAMSRPARRDELVANVGGRIDVLILDEAQRLKNLGARVTESIYGAHANGTGLVAIAARTWVLSGTLCPNHVGELYTHLRALFPASLPQGRHQPINYTDFLYQFAEWDATRWGGIQVHANKNLGELKPILDPIVITRTRAEVEAQLPPLTVSEFELDRSTIDEAAYMEFIESQDGQRLDKYLAGPWDEPDARDPDDIPNLAEALHRLGDLKAAAVANYVRQLLMNDADARVIVFGHHHTVLRRIVQDLRDVDPDAGMIDGHTPDGVRSEIIAAYQAKAMRLLVLGIGTAREGITLTAANRVVFAEASWVPAHNDQAIHRAARIGQTRPVIAEFVTVTDTLDEVVMRTCLRKTRLLSEIFA